LKNSYRLRVENCIGTIIDVHKSISAQYENQEFLSQFEQLKQAIRYLDLEQVCEKDILKVEQATNDLLREFKTVFETGNLGPVYRSVKN